MNSRAKELILFCMISVFAGLSCKKEPETYCWQGFSPLGADVRGLLVCNKTEAEVQAAYPQYWFYNNTEAKFCWKVKDANGNVFYMRQVPVSMMEKLKNAYAFTAVTEDCNNFCIWQWQEKRKSKTTGQFGPTRATTETYAADSCTKLYVGRTIVVRETADSIYYREFVEKMP